VLIVILQLLKLVLLHQLYVNPDEMQLQFRSPWFRWQVGNGSTFSKFIISHAISGPGVAASVPTYEAPIRGPETVLDRLLRLDSWARSGLSESEFNRLFAKCRCGLIMTRRVFRGHICAVAVGTMRKKPAVIDLTLDEGDNFVRERSSQLNVIDLTMDSDEELQ
jgi:hypothetical protein